MAGTNNPHRVQNIVYALEVGLGARILKGFLYILFVLLMGFLYMATQYVGFNSPRAMNQAQLGRTLSETGSYRTRVITPQSLKFLQEQGKLSADSSGRILTLPELREPPLYPALLAGAFRAGKAEDFAYPNNRKVPAENLRIVPLNLLLVMLAGLMLYLSGRTLFDPSIALMTVSLFFLTERIWGLAVAGTEFSLFLCLSSFLFFALLRLMRRSQQELKFLLPYLLWSVWIGACLLGLLLTNYLSAWLIPGILLMIFAGMKRARWISLSVLLLLPALGMAGWMAYLFQTSGSPFGLAHMAAVDGGEHVAQRSLHWSMEAGEVVQSIQANILGMVEAFFSLEDSGVGFGLISGLFIAALVYRFQKSSPRIFRWALLLMSAGLLLGAGLFGRQLTVYLHVLLPFILLYSVAFLFLLVERLQIQVNVVRLALLTGFVLVHALPFIAKILPPRPSSYPPYVAGDVGLVTQFFAKDEVLVSDMPWATAWYGGNSSIWMPMDIEDFYEIHDRYTPVQGLYITLITKDQPMHRMLVSGPLRTWMPLLSATRLPQGFPLEHVVPIRNGEQVLYADQPRWDRSRR